MKAPKFILLFVFLFSVVGLFAQNDQEKDLAWISSYEPHTYNGMSYRLMRPTDVYFEQNKLYPVIVSLHGGAGRGGEVDAFAIKDLPIWAFHGDQDSTVAIEGNQELFAEMQKIGGNMKFTTWIGSGHDVTTKFITGSKNGITQLSSDRCDPEPDLLEWFFKHKLSD